MAYSMYEEPYFIWNGINSKDMGVVVAAYPSRFKSEARVTEYEVPGRDGVLTIADGSFKAIALSVTCYVKPQADINELCRWLQGKGTVIFGKWPDRSYQATIFSAIEFGKLLRGYEWSSFSVSFKSVPYAHDSEYGNLIEVPSSGTTIWNPGDFEVPAIVEVIGTFSSLEITVGGVTATISDVEDPIDGMLMDWEAQDCYTLTEDDDGTYSYLGNGNTMVTIDQSAPTGAEQKLIQGYNTITWSIPSTATGSVEHIYIKNNWRYYG